MFQYFALGILTAYCFTYFYQPMDNNCKINIEMEAKLKKALKDKIEATEENLKLAKLCKKSEERHINLLFKMEELHESLRAKSLKLKEYLEENQNLKDEIAMLNHLIHD